MPANVLLLRWHGGWAEVEDTVSTAAIGRAEALLSIGAVQSLTEAQRVGAGQLSVFANPRTQVDLAVDVIADDETPYLGFTPGDTITVPDEDGLPTLERVQSVAVTEDENGVVVYVPTVKDVILGAEERFANAVKKLNDGTVGGTPVATRPLPSATG